MKFKEVQGKLKGYLRKVKANLRKIKGKFREIFREQKGSGALTSKCLANLR